MSEEKLRKEIGVLLDAIFDDVEVKQKVYEEKRAEERRQVLIPAILTSRDGTFACIIRNISLQGAKIAVARNAKLVDGMWLRVEGKKPREVSFRWRKGELVGVQFR